jgi:hypothetical protein
MEWWWTALILLGGLVVLGAVLAMRIRRDRFSGTEGPDVFDDPGTHAAERGRDDPEIRQWGAGGPG